MMRLARARLARSLTTRAPRVARALAWLAALLLSSAPTHAWQKHGYVVVRTYPHDATAWTQGLVFRDGVLYEGTGQHGRSELREVDLASGDVIRARPLADRYYGEGIAIWRDRIVQLTWNSQTGFVYDLDSWEQIGAFHYPGEGWGITHDGAHLIMSDGSPVLRFLDPTSFEEVRRIEVTFEGKPLASLNELEFVQGEIWANVWQSDFIARIAPQDGQVLGLIALHGLLSAEERAAADVLNGIAYDAEGDRIFVTGKLWPKLFEIELVAPP